MKFFQTVCATLLLAIAPFAAASDAPSGGEKLLRTPHPGPYTESIASVAEWKVAEGYLALDPDDTTRLMEKMQNPDIRDHYLVAPKSLDPWFAVIHYEETGHVKDDEKIDADELLKSIKEGTERGNEARRQRGWSDMHVVGWKYPPHYEEDTKRLSWAVINTVDNQQNINYFTKILSRTGVAEVVLVTDDAHLDASVADLKQQLAGFNFTAGHQYGEFTKGDKIAEYGLAGLIVGGAGAAAVKMGFGKWLFGILAAGWKLIAVAFAAVVGGIKSLFTGKRRE